MNKLFSKIAAASVGLAMAVGVGVAAGHEAKAVKADGTTVSFDHSEVVGMATTATANTSGTYDVFTITVSNGLNASESIRVYKNETITISSSGGNITEVVFTCTAQGSAKYGPGSMSGDGYVAGSDATGTWTGDAESFTLTANANQVRVVSFAITYTDEGGGGGSTTYKVTYNANDTASRRAAGVPSAVTDLEDGAEQTLTGSPTRWGYSFKGWGATADATETISSVTIDGADVNVYALWNEDHTVHGAWSDAPYSVAEVIAAIDVDKTKTYASVYTTGIVCQVDSFNSTYGSVTYWISDDGTTDGAKFEAFGGLGIDKAQFSKKEDVEVGATVVLCGDAKYYSGSGGIYEYNANNYMISYEAPSTGDIDVTFEPATTIAVGDSGTYSASTTASNPIYVFSSSDESVLEVAENGSFAAAAAGKATVTVNVTADEGEGHRSVEVTVVEVKTVSEAVAIAATLDGSSQEKTDYMVKVTGAISDLDADGNARAVNFTDGSEVIMAFFGKGNADYTEVVGAANIGSKLSIYAKIQNYKGTYELMNIVLIGVDDADADSYAAAAYKSLDSACSTGVSAVTADQWSALAAGFNALEPSEQEKFREEDVSVYGENVVNWVNRYEIIVSNSSLNNFMALTSVQSMYVPGSETDSGKVIIIIIAATFAVTTFGAILLIRKKKHSK